LRPCCRFIDDKLSIQKSSIGGNQYLAYLWGRESELLYIRLVLA
jgi:hypothetical protein